MEVEYRPRGGQGLKSAGAAGLGWSWSPSAEAAASVSAACVFPSMLMSPVCWCHVHMGAQFLLHTGTLPLHGSCLGGCWPGYWLGLSVAMRVHVTSDPEHARP